MLRTVLAFAVCAGLAASLAVHAADAPKSETTSGEYVGLNKCKMCHTKEYKAWAAADTKHALALETLKATTADQLKHMNEVLKTSVTDPATDSACVRCHVTGYRQPGGYPASDSLKNANLSFVGCEVCHGPGSKHLAVPMSNKEGRKASIGHPTEETCRNCHLPEISPKFDFATWSKRVHPIAAAAPAK
ncbi:MAG TPA: cytochrome c family protein [Terriglobales bacterium]|nr:cytochrome c family protein [Terriglobales bacterium]